MIVAASGLLGCVAVGAMFSLPVFLRPMSQNTGWSVTVISLAMTLAFLSVAFGSIAWGGLSERVHPWMIVQRVIGHPPTDQASAGFLERSVIRFV
ncbi:hypothetical protein [Sphingomonas sp.]|uniref:hypothetical protein n=1 Tax=Sphingomonas sp. TaxID=28214 RepID=UPI00260B6C99|nr:hypothetical protein [Sphingomonas sp.]